MYSKAVHVLLHTSSVTVINAFERSITVVCSCAAIGRQKFSGKTLVRLNVSFVCLV